MAGPTIGVTSDLARRIWQHRHSALPGFGNRYAVHRLVWLEMADDLDAVITREQQLKKWNRIWKLRLIEASNPEWRDPAVDLDLIDAAED